jgi:hypothetical protein
MHCRPTLRSEGSDLTKKNRDYNTNEFAKQSSSESHDRRNVPSLDSFKSHDSKIVKQIEDEEIAARRHRINRMKAKKQKAVVKERLFDMFGIEEETKVLNEPNTEVVGESNIKQCFCQQSHQSSGDDPHESIKSRHSEDKLGTIHSLHRKILSMPQGVRH